jgi:hypothetical protein
VTDFRTVVEEDALPKPSQLRGLVKGMTAGEKAEDYLRKLRGDGPGLPHRASLFLTIIAFWSAPPSSSCT